MATTPRKPSPDKFVDAAMALAAERRWRDISLADIAAEAKGTLPQLHEAFRSKQAIIVALVDRIDTKVLADQEDASGEPVRERLLDVLMRRFEALAPYKKGRRVHDPRRGRPSGGDPVRRPAVDEVDGVVPRGRRRQLGRAVRAFQDQGSRGDICSGFVRMVAG